MVTIKHEYEVIDCLSFAVVFGLAESPGRNEMASLGAYRFATMGRYRWFELCALHILDRQTNVGVQC